MLTDADICGCDIGVGALLNMEVSPADKDAASRISARLFAALTEVLTDADVC
jgi:hypothetical protein